MTDVEDTPEPSILPSEVPGAAVLFDISMKRADVILSTYHETHRRAAVVFGFSNVLVAAAAVAIGKMNDAAAPLWLIFVASLTLAALYMGTSISCYQALRLRKMRMLFDPRLVFNQIAGEPLELAKARISQTVLEPQNERSIAEVNAKARHLQRAIVLSVVMGCLIFLGGLAPPLLQRRNSMAQEEKDRATKPRDEGAQVRTEMRAAGVSAPAKKALDMRLTPVSINWDDDQLILMDARSGRYPRQKK